MGSLLVSFVFVFSFGLALVGLSYVTSDSVVAASAWSFLFLFETLGVIRPRAPGPGRRRNPQAPPVDQDPDTVALDDIGVADRFHSEWEGKHTGMSGVRDPQPRPLGQLHHPKVG